MFRLKSLRPIFIWSNARALHAKVMAQCSQCVSGRKRDFSSALLGTSKVRVCCVTPIRLYTDWPDQDPTFHTTENRRLACQRTDTETEQNHNTVKRQPVFNIDVLVSLLRQENAVDICVIRVPAEIKYCDYFVVVSGSSTRHIRAMALYAIKVYKFMRSDDAPHARVEGKDADDWMCIDFGTMVVHFMLPETRMIYELEKLWTLRSFDEQLSSIPAEQLPPDFVYGAEDTK
ncbi:mitochondrial assembly of ribosomal large subunit protein 1 [Chanos chanos]|uniref:Mitochondrial assembly of ribosomal large subunit protein 1 n=1 Tax=Chanos chanos TaxID=29144 RepID=A0A6J2WWJ1_CHACN|nr:mitochondrial assembly of ribosomal large subunit protein 1 [Chanos chanos]